MFKHKNGKNAKKFIFSFLVRNYTQVALVPSHNAQTLASIPYVHITNGLKVGEKVLLVPQRLTESE